MQNLKPTHFSVVADRPSAVSDVLDRVVGIAPAPLLPSEKETDYAEVALAIVKAAHPKDAIEDLLTRDVIDLSWEVLRLRRLKAGLLRGRHAHDPGDAKPARSIVVGGHAARIGGRVALAMAGTGASFDRPTIEVADILRRHGEAYLRDHVGHVGRTEQCDVRFIDIISTLAARYRTRRRSFLGS